MRVLVIDDSAQSRRAIAGILEVSPLVEVVGIASDGDEALRKALELAPDLITLDLGMPRMDGFTFLRLLMAARPTPVVVISANAGDQNVFKALELGAVDFVAKPGPDADLSSIERELLHKVSAVRDLRMENLGAIAAPVPPPPLGLTRAAEAPHRVVLIGASTGGPAAIMRLLSGFSTAPPCAVLVSQHMPAGFTRGFAERIDRLTPFDAREASGGEEPRAGLVLVAPGGAHLELESVAGRILTRVPKKVARDRYAPSVDRLFVSAAKHFGEELLAIVLTGMGSDGRAGAEAVKNAGGTVVAESEESAVVFGMPAQVIQSGVTDAILPLGEIGFAMERGLPSGGGTR